MNKEDNVQLVEESLLSYLANRFLYPFLYTPIENLDTFLSENRHLLTQIGVFGAVSIYLRTVDNELEKTAKLFGEFALVAGFALVIVLSVVLLAKLVCTLRTEDRIFAYQNIGLLAFSAFFVPLVLIIVGVVSQFSQIWAVYFYMATYLGTLVFVGIFGIIVRKLSAISSELLPTNETVASTISLGLFSIIGLYIAATSSIMQIEDSAIFSSGNATIVEWLSLFAGAVIVLVTLAAITGFVINVIGVILDGLAYLLVKIWRTVSGVVK